MHPGLSREELTKLFHGDVPWQQVDLILSDCSEERNIDDIRSELSALALQRVPLDKTVSLLPQPSLNKPEGCTWPDCDCAVAFSDSGPPGPLLTQCPYYSWTPEALIAFEKDIADTFNRGEIKAPIHLEGGNEQQLIDIFKDIRPQDWKCCSWRSHLKCLLSGVPPQELKDAIVAGRSIGLCFPAQRVISSALVGGIVPIALGLAWAAKHRNEDEKVWCFVGDMTAHCGLVYECLTYAKNDDLPLIVVIEDNRKSVATNTAAAWGDDFRWLPGGLYRYYRYKLSFPHVGTGTWVHM